jgi:CheY-like chemotaxis protein
MAALILALLEEHDNSKQVKDCLEPSGHQVFVVDTFVKAKALLKTQNIDLIISDVHLENGGSVFDFLRWVKKAERTAEIPFVLFSSKPSPVAKYLADGVRTASRMLGAIKYIEMDSFDGAQFREHINGLLPQGKLIVEADTELTNKVGE